MTITAEDYAAIQMLYARVYAAADAGNAEGFGACFTEDGTLTIAGRLASSGRAALVARSRTNSAARVGKRRRHLCSQLLLESLGNGAVKGQCYFQAFDIVPGSLPALTHMGVCDDVIVRDQGEWRFASRSVSFDFPV